MTDLTAASILHKTEAGISAIKLRDRALTPMLRMLLIVVDGHKPVAELIKSLPQPDEARAQLAKLLAAGFVEVTNAAPAGSAPAGSTPAAPVATPAAPTGSAGSEEELKLKIRRATRLLDAMLGPDSEALSLQIERCKTLDQFNAKALEISRIVTAIRSEKKGSDFLLATTSSVS